MTGADYSSHPFGEITPGAGVTSASEGEILQRGGEELALEKVGDRFTLRLADGANPTSISQQLGASAVRSVPGVQLLELQVNPTQLEQTMNTARRSDAILFASHVYQLQKSPGTLAYITDEVTVQFAQAIDLEAIAPVATSMGLTAVQAVEGIPHTYIFRVTKQAVVNPIKLANQLMRRSDVLTAEPNVVIRSQEFYRPQDSLYSKQWYLYNSGAADTAANAHISVEQAWDITRGERSVVVAVMDDAFDLNHPDFQGKGKIAAPKDLKKQDMLPMPEANFENHGTAAAGLAIAEENNVGIVGVAPGCTLMPIRTTGFLDDNAIEELFNWAIQQGAAVISCSWGPSAVYFPLSLRQRAVLTKAATQGRKGKGCVVVFAAGNANRPVSGAVNEQGWPNNVLRGPTNWLNGFTVHPDVITVAASTSLGKKAAYSNWGDQISVAAPSSNGAPGTWLQQTGYINTAPTIRTALTGKGVFTSDRLGSAGYDAGSFTENFGGTSSACPIVAGVAALVLSANPDLSAKDVKQILQFTTDKIVDPDVDPQLGLRKGSYDANGHSEWFGYGKVNAAKAVQMARQQIKALPTPSRRLQQGNTNAVAIPDFNTQGVISPIQITNASPVKDIRVSLDIEHSFMGDLEISLISPQGQTVLLQGRTLGRQTRLQTTYSLQTTPLLGQMVGLSASGRWQLRLVDLAPQDTGRLRSWQLDLGI